MSDVETEVLDEVIEDLRRVLAKCDQSGVGTVAAIYVDLAMHLAMQERDPRREIAA